MKPSRDPSKVMCTIFDHTLWYMVDVLNLTPNAENITTLAINVDDLVRFRFDSDDVVTICFSDGSQAILRPVQMQ